MSEDLAALACSKITNFSHLTQLHAHLIHSSLHHHNYWVSLVLTHCRLLNASLRYSRHVFSSATYPDFHVFMAMLRYLSQLGTAHQVLSLFRHMIRGGGNVKPGAFVFPLVIKAAGEACIAFHAHVLKLGHANDPYIRNVMLDTYGKHGPFEVAWKLFDEMTDKKLPDWNSVISGCWKWGNEAEACRLFNLMPERNVITWTAMITGYAKLKDLVSARRYFDEMPAKSVESWNAMLSGYAQNDFAEEALNLFSDMVRAGVQPNETTLVTVLSACSSCGDPSLSDSILKIMKRNGFKMNCFVKTALLSLYAKQGNLEGARRIFDELGVYKSSVTWNAMISAYTRVGRLDSARELFCIMPDRDVISWNSMIAGYAQNGHSTVAIELFKEMVSTKQFQPDEVTMVSVISACGHLGALELGNWVTNLISNYEIKLTVSGYNSLIFMYSKCGNMKEAQRIFCEMEIRDVVSYNTLISGFAAHGQGKDAIELMTTMKEEGILPDRITYIGVLTACSHEGLLEEGRKVFESIRNPSVDHFACMVDLLGRVGQLDEAMILIDNMPMEPHSGVYGSLLNASRIHKRIEFGQLAANKLFELEPQNSGNYVLLSNIYVSTGRWKDAANIRQMMRRERLRKGTGWSCVEYKDELHKFVVGDRMHARSHDIYRLLTELLSKMRTQGYSADKSCALRDVEEEEKEEMVGIHSEKLAICFSLLVGEVGSVIRVVKNLRVCWDCHTWIKMVSALVGREIIVRDNNRFHCFNNGLCSCKDHW